MQGNPFAHIVDGFRPVIGKYLGQPQSGQPNPLPSALAYQGGLPVQTSQAMTPSQPTPPTQVDQNPMPQTPQQLTRNLPNMRTTPRTPLLGAYNPTTQQSAPVTQGTPSNPMFENPFLAYLNQMFGPNANRRTNLKFPSYLRNMPVAGNQSANPLGGTQNPRNIGIPQQYSIPQNITSTIGAFPGPNPMPYTVVNATNYQANNPTQGGIS